MLPIGTILVLLITFDVRVLGFVDILFEPHALLHDKFGLVWYDLE